MKKERKTDSFNKNEEKVKRKMASKKKKKKENCLQ